MTSLPDLRTSLEACTWHHLFAIARAHGLRCSNRWSKLALLEAVYHHLNQPDLLPTIIPQLPAASHEALQALLRADGSLPYRPFTQQFGEIRPYRPWRKDSTSPSDPWLNPTSPLEHLWYLGFVFAHPPKLNGGLAQRLYLPAESVRWLQRTQPQIENASTWRPLSKPGRPPDLLWHVAIYLATAAAEPLPLLQGRWPTPSTLNALIARFGLDGEPGFQRSRSEKRMPYLAFLHFLAEASGLIAHTRLLHVTPVGWHWLQSPTSHRRRMLWDGFLRATGEMVTPYAFPWFTPGEQRWSLLLTQLATLSTHNYEPIADFITAIQVQDRFGYVDHADGTQLAGLLAQPLHWFGVVEVAQNGMVSGTRADLQANSPEALPVESNQTVTSDWVDFIATDSDDLKPAPQPAQPALGLRLTSVGAWLLGVTGWDAPTEHPPQSAIIRRGAPDTWCFAPDASAAHLARVSAYTTWDPPVFPDVAQRLTLDSDRVGRTIAAGVPPAQIFHDLQDALDRPLSRRQGQLLRKWAKSAQQAGVRTVTLLETTDAALMGKLRSRRHSRALLGAPLSPTRSEINPDHLTALVDHLATMDIFVSPPTRGPDPAAEFTPPTGEADLFYLGLRLLIRLGAHLPLPIAAPYDQLDALRRTLTHDQLAAADAHVQAILDEIEALLSGYLRLPAWRIQVDGKGVWPRLQRALANEETLTIRYWNAEQNHPTERRITPYYVETRRHTRYLHAYCHLRQEERIFRVDRIECILNDGDDDGQRAEDSGTTED